MKEVRMYQAPFMSFFSGDLYRDVARKWTGIGFGYLTVVTLVCVAFSSIGLTIAINNKAEELLAKLPAITFSKDHKLSIDKPVPHVVQLDIPGEQNKLVFDTSGKMTSLEDAPGAIALVTADELILTDRATEENRASWKSLNADESWSLNRSNITKVKTVLGQVIWGLMVVAGLFSLFGHYFLALLYGAIGLIMSNVTGAKLGFGAAVRLAVVAMTPGMIISMGLWVIGQTALTGLWGWLSVPVTLGYLYFACAAAAKDSPEAMVS
ncbi:MAG: DUF1189 domain-containing protein [Candidatus Obscuribacterales bacterium]|nr:DUF1189 domain-containing protein [Candidatus Obscuribacterales bacterium]